ncbi:DUF4390 domain-containing protein [Thiorhodococcus mannitoliphagus]|uniref:DUF4390 domain-containing protein n=1 Tax=Thiorhodococcus mannitoliphagus TaxID=329406 RepID=A0A6P1DRV0_9GAMM|nr:DUF4390 domain-containing protein [Thiorhodococcus mannitoliphagus]NEX19651.1 DUF4390 domain-containing protein [Thiorhodococcus mannitoliphagus]
MIGATALGLNRLVVMGIVLTISTAALARADFELRQVQTRLEASQYFLNARVDFNPSEDALEALDNGVPLTVVFHLQIRRTKAWLWEDSLLDLQLRYAVRYKPLSERYEVYRLPGTKGKDFVTRDAAIRALGELRDIALVSQGALEPEQDYELQMKAFLDIEELPLPLRPTAYLKPSWKLSSGWSKWPLTP